MTYRVRKGERSIELRRIETEQRDRIIIYFVDEGSISSWFGESVLQLILSEIRAGNKRKPGLGD